MRQKIKAVLIGFIVLPLIGFFYDAINGFYILRNTKSIYGIIIGIILTVIIISAGEYVAETINTKDNVSDPLYKRAFRLLLLLVSVSIIVSLYWFIFHYFELLKI